MDPTLPTEPTEPVADPVAAPALEAPAPDDVADLAAFRAGKTAAPVEAPPATPELEADSPKADGDVSEAARTLRRQRGEERKRQIQKEIDDLTRQRYALRAEVDALQRKPAPAPTAPAAAADKPTVDQFDNYEDFAEALADFKAREIVAAEFSRRDSAQAQARTFDSFRERVAAFQEAHPDYVEALTNFPIGIPIEMENALRDLDDGPAIAYHLATSPDGVATVERLAALPPAHMLIALGRLTAKVSQPAPPPAKPITKAPAPITPVGGPATQPLTRDPKDITSIREYRARRDEFVGTRS